MGTGEEAGGSTCVTEKVVEYFLIFNNMLGEVWCSGGETYPGGIVFWSTRRPPALILPFLVEIVMIYTNNHVSSSMFHASSKPLQKKLINLATCSKQQHNVIAENI